MLLSIGMSPGTSAFAEESADVHPFLADTWNIQLGVYLPRRDINIRVDGSIGGDNDSIDFGDELGLGSSEDFFSGEIIWRYGEKWSLRTQYFDASGSGSAVLDEDIEWGDYTIKKGSYVTAGTSMTTSRVFFGRSFDSDPRYDYGIGLGLHWLEPGAYVQGELIVNFGETYEVSASGPLPNIGGWFYYSPSEKWYLGGRLDWFEASVGDYSGSIINVALGANYQFAEHFGAGVKYQVFEFDADIRNYGIWRGRLKTKLEGMFFYLSGNW